jgi:hypothetical protein
MTELEAQLRGLMLLDAKVYRARNQIAERTDPLSEKGRKNAARLARKKAQAEPSETSSEEPNNEISSLAGRADSTPARIPRQRHKRTA